MEVGPVQLTELKGNALGMPPDCILACQEKAGGPLLDFGPADAFWGVRVKAAGLPNLELPRCKSPEILDF